MDSDKDRLAAEVEDCWSAFETELGGRRAYPTAEFQLFFDAVKRYAECTKKDELIHRKVVMVVQDLTEQLRLDRKRVPGTVLRDADRLECLLFAGYDPYFAGHEPPGL